MLAEARGCDLVWCGTPSARARSQKQTDRVDRIRPQPAADRAPGCARATGAGERPPAGLRCTACRPCRAPPHPRCLFPTRGRVTVSSARARREQLRRGAGGGAAMGTGVAQEGCAACASMGSGPGPLRARRGGTGWVGCAGGGQSREAKAGAAPRAWLLARPLGHRRGARGRGDGARRTPRGCWERRRGEAQRTGFRREGRHKRGGERQPDDCTITARAAGRTEDGAARAGAGARTGRATAGRRRQRDLGDCGREVGLAGRRSLGCTAGRTAARPETLTRQAGGRGRLRRRRRRPRCRAGQRPRWPRARRPARATARGRGRAGRR
jgi:hypothetical protein